MNKNNNYSCSKNKTTLVVLIMNILIIDNILIYNYIGGQQLSVKDSVAEGLP